MSKQTTTTTENTDAGNGKRGPRCKELVAYRKQVFQPGDYLPADTPPEILAKLKEQGNI